MARWTSLEQLKAAEQYWTQKTGLRLAILALDVVGLGCAIAAVVSAFNPYFARVWDYNNDGIYIIWTIVVMAISLLLCATTILAPLFRRERWPVHSGILIASNLLLLVAFAVTGPIAIAALVSNGRFEPYGIGGDASYGDDNYSGHYVHALNGTWVYRITHSRESFDEFSGRILPTTDLKSIIRDCTPEYTSCAEQDRYVNDMYLAQSGRRGIELVVAIAQWPNLVLHFVLFAWACFDVYRNYAATNAAKGDGKEEELTDKVVRLMQNRGMLAVDRSEAKSLMAGAGQDGHELEQLKQG